jgi:hypothetical protein
VSRLVVVHGGREEGIDLDATLDPAETELAEHAANAWIKALRHATVDGVPLRDRFTLRGDSLWWFFEIYLHRMRVIVRAHRAVAALERLARDRPGAGWRVDGRDHVVGHAAHAVARRHGIACTGVADARQERRGLAARAKAVSLTAAAMADRLRPVLSPRVRGVQVAAFVHSAFVGRDGSREAYVGPIIQALDKRLPPGGLHLVGLGPRTNFRVRNWADRLREFVTPQPRRIAATNITSFAGWQALAPSREVWRTREATHRALAGSDSLRDASRVGGLDLWPVVLEQLRGVADLQLPWSARAMDEAGAALDALRPRVVLTYAEAGGWGRALVLEARRRGVPTVAAQHGFIYRHWLNYLHEPDEMLPSPTNPVDRGFPRPDLTLLFDDFAREHLVEHGHFPPAALAVTGSPRLDAIVGAARRFGDADRRRLRDALGATGDAPVVIVAAKHAQLGASYPALVEAARGMPGIRLVVKPHPAEGDAPYRAAAADVANVVIAPADADLGQLTAIAAALVTANSTAAIEAMPLDVPALVVGLPNNLSPFVDAGAMAGVHAPAEVAPALRALLYDREMRQRLSAAREAFLARYGIRGDGGAASRAADAIISLSRS